MSILCFIGGHRPSRNQVWNRGYSFSKCRRCRRDMVRSDGDWSLVPRGHRVVWKKGYHCHSMAPLYTRNLPILYRGAMPVEDAPVFRGRGGAVAADERGEAPPYPAMIAAAAVAGAGLQRLLGIGADIG